jgi:hypothetical protein
MAGLYTGAIGLWGGLPGLISSTTLSTPPSLLANVGGIAATGANLALWFDTNQAYKSSGGGIVTPDSILTYTAPSPKLVYGTTGVLGYAPHNLLLRSDDFENATSWGRERIGSVTQTAIAAPFGSNTVELISEDNTSGRHNVSQSAASLISGRTYTFSCFAKDNGGVFVNLSPNSTGFYFSAVFNLSTGLVHASAASGSGWSVVSTSIVDFGNGWYRCAVTGTMAATSLSCAIAMSGSGTIGAFGMEAYTGTSRSIYVWGAQLNNGDTALTYIPTTTAAVYSLPRDHNPTTGAALGVLVEEQRVNLCLYSDDFTNVAWVKSNLTAAKTATGPDGVANSASTLTATAANATALQAITSTSAARITSMFVKRRTGTGVVEMTQDNGSTWTAVTVTAGWTRVNIATATAANPTVGIRIVTDTDAIDVDLFQHELGAFITSPVATQASQVTRVADRISILTSAFPYSATAGTIAVVARPILANSLAGAVSLNDGSGNEEIVLYRDASGNLVYQVEDGGANQLAPLDSGQNAADLTEYKMAAAWAANDFATAVGGNAAVTDTSGTLPTVNTLEVGVNQANNYVNGHIKRLDYYAVRKTDAELVVLST